MAKRQAELKAKLAITPAQEPAWTAWTATMQPPATRPAHPSREEIARSSTPERIDKMRALRAERQAEMDKRADATKAFYNSLNADRRRCLTPRQPASRRAGPRRPPRHAPQGLSAQQAPGSRRPRPVAGVRGARQGPARRQTAARPRAASAGAGAGRATSSRHTPPGPAPPASRQRPPGISCASPIARPFAVAPQHVPSTRCSSPGRRRAWSGCAASRAAHPAGRPGAPSPRAPGPGSPPPWCCGWKTRRAAPPPSAAHRHHRVRHGARRLRPVNAVRPPRCICCTTSATSDSCAS